MNLSSEDIIGWVAAKCEALGADDYSIQLFYNDEGQARFSNGSLTITNRLLNKEVDVYIAKGRKRILGSLSSMKKESVTAFVEHLFSSLTAGGAESDFPRLPAGPFSYSYNGDFDPQVDHFDLAGNAAIAIEAAEEAGAKRVAGSLSTNHVRLWIRTSTGVDRSEERSRFLLNVRSFTDRDASGHGLSVSTTVKGFDPEGAGRVSGEGSKSCRHPREVEVGDYTVIFNPTVAADIVQRVGQSASAFGVDAGLSFLANQLGKTVAAEDFTLIDHGQIVNGVGSRSFDDEGVPTRSNVLIDRGVLKTYVHNSTTAAKQKAELTGNAGLIEPHVWNLEVAPGDYTLEEMIRETKKGIYVTNNWYTRFQSYATGEYSTLPRDAAWLIEGGELKHPVAGIRISGEIPRQLKSIDALGKERNWVKWWEVEVPTLAPALRIPNVRVTKASG
jgi:PmbA protein